MICMDIDNDWFDFCLASGDQFQTKIHFHVESATLRLLRSHKTLVISSKISILLFLVASVFS